jgi:hypothetical protein
MRAHLLGAGGADQDGIDVGGTEARLRQRRPRGRGRELVQPLGAATWRSLVPVRREIHSSSTPSLAAITALVMTCSGTAMPTPTSAAPARPAGRPVTAGCGNVRIAAA